MLAIFENAQLAGNHVGMLKGTVVSKLQSGGKKGDVVGFRKVEGWELDKLGLGGERGWCVKFFKGM